VPPLKFTTFPLYAVVPPVPSRAARETRMPSTLAWSSFIPVIVTLPPTDFNVDPNENVTKFAAVIVIVDPNVTIAGRLNVVKLANDGENAPVIVVKLVNVTDVQDENEDVQAPDTVTKAGKLSDVTAAVMANAPPMVTRDVNVRVVSKGTLIPSAPINITDGILKVVSAGIEAVLNTPAIVTKLGRLRVVNRVVAHVILVPM
jgi:hypothetical protein